ncbi:MAG: hypothetical protein QOG97_2220 [Acidimicrobiaceae bacterium]|nr:hypothetical protein [Acidimicrobiaceae bacterium]
MGNEGETRQIRYLLAVRQHLAVRITMPRSRIKPRRGSPDQLTSVLHPASIAGTLQLPEHSAVLRDAPWVSAMTNARAV